MTKHEHNTCLTDNTNSSACIVSAKRKGSSKQEKYNSNKPVDMNNKVDGLK